MKALKYKNILFRFATFIAGVQPVLKFFFVQGEEEWWAF